MSCAGPRLSLCGQGREPASPSSPDSTQLVPPHGLKALTHPCHPPKTCFGSRRWLVFSMSEEVQPCPGSRRPLGHHGRWRHGAGGHVPLQAAAEGRGWCAVPPQEAFWKALEQELPAWRHLKVPLMAEAPRGVVAGCLRVVGWCWLQRKAKLKSRRGGCQGRSGRLPYL